VRRTSQQTREHVLGVARDLFYWEGIRATGVDRIAREAGVAPTTLYRLFANKDDLIAAYLEREAAAYRDWFLGAVGDDSDDPAARIVSVFDALAGQVQAAECRGCPFQMGLAELFDASLPGHTHAVAVKVWTREQLRRLTSELADESPGLDADLLADQLMLVLEGMYAVAMSFDAAHPASSARSLVQHLLADAQTARD